MLFCNIFDFFLEFYHYQFGRLSIVDCTHFYDKSNYIHMKDYINGLPSVALLML